MTSDEIELAVHDLDGQLRACQPSIQRVFVRPVQPTKRRTVGAGMGDVGSLI
jgi:hypothetical protein